MIKPKEYHKNVFINCPFDTDYNSIFKAIIFTIFDCGFIPKCTYDLQDGCTPRINKIYHLIDQCQHGIHDISRTELDDINNLPRFNMPFELGIFLGSKHFGNKANKEKSCIILDSEQYRFQKFLSDIGGQDPKTHNNDYKKVIELVRDYLNNYCKEVIPTGTDMILRYEDFIDNLPSIAENLNLSITNTNQIDYKDFLKLLAIWLTETDTVE